MKNVNAWCLVDDILLEVSILQKVQRVYVDDIAQLTISEKSKEDTMLRLTMLDFLGEAISKRMKEIQEGLSRLANVISAEG